MTTFPYTVVISGRADAFMRGTGLVQGKPDNDTGSASLADAYKRRITKRSGKGYSVRLDFADKAGVRVLAEYMDAGVVANQDDGGNKSEARACAIALERCRKVLGE